MDAPLLSTKYAIPPVRPELVPRTHLIARLSAGLERKCTLVSAPAGFGKTTLVSAWIHSVGGSTEYGVGSRQEQASDSPLIPYSLLPTPHFAWLSLDESDNDPVRFSRYVMAALQSALPGLDKAASNLAMAATAPSLTHALTVLINEIAVLGIEKTSHLVLVLDDYHTIKASAIHDGLAFLLDHLPANMHVALVTRADPPLPLSRLRARNQLLEIRVNDLRFTPVEAAAFLNQVMGLHLSVDDIQALEVRTEGWIVGLQMAALALQSTGMLPGGGGTAGFVQAFLDSNRYILEYLVEEVLECQPDHVQAFLLRTAILNRLTGPLCDAVRGEADAALSGQEMLEWLERANLFIVPLDNQSVWYRYHHLFADLLRQRLRRSEPALVPELHRRASQWYEQNGLIEQAIDHALIGEDMERAARLVERGAEAVMMRSELVTLLAWLEVLPKDLVRQRPLLCLYYAAALLLSGEPPAKIQTYLEIAATRSIPDSVTHGTVVLRALLALWQGDMTQSLTLGQQALASLPEQNLFWRGIVTGNLGIAYMANGRDLDLAGRMLEEAASLGERAGSVMGAVIALCNLAELRIARGQLWAAKRLYDRALDLAVDHRGHHLPIGGMAVIGTAGLLQEWNELQEAERLLVTAIDLTSEKLPIWAVDGYLVLARVKQSQGDGKAAQEAIEQARTVAASTGATELDDWIVAAAQACLWIAQGHLDAAAHWARGRGLLDRPVADAVDTGRSSPFYSLYELEHLTLAELWIAQEDTRRALDVLAALLARSSALQRTDSVIKILILMALAHHQLKHPDQALAALAQALGPAQSGGYVRTFLDRGPRMASLLRQALAQGVAVDYVQRLLTAYGPGAAPPARSQTLVEPLSDRELQVLRLLAAYLSSTEIAEELYISANTVRFHLKNIYAKLNVHTRRDAVERAKELGLL